MQNKNTNVNTFYSLGVSVLERSMQGHVLESSKMETTLDDSWDWCPTEDLPVILVIYKDVWGSETIPQRICRISYLSIIHRSTKIHEKHCKGSYSQEVTEDKNNMLLSISQPAEDHQDIQQHRCSEAVRTERTKVELPGEKYMLLCLEKNTTYHKAPRQNVKLEKKSNHHQ